MNTLFSLAIIGCGLTGTSMLYQLIRMIQTQKKIKVKDRISSPVCIIVFEEKNTTGPGFPYDPDTQFLFHITNMPAGDMSIAADDPDNFSRWFTARKTRLKSEYPQLGQWFSDMEKDPSNKLFFPRILMGKYLEDCFETALKTAESLGIMVTVKKKWMVTDITDQGDHLNVIAVDTETGITGCFTAKRVLLATGHWAGHHPVPGYFPSPWPARDLLDRIPEGEKAAVIGTSLSAIDAALTLLSDGTFKTGPDGTVTFVPAQASRKVTLFSRKGLLPKVRGLKKSRANRFFSTARLKALIDEKKETLLLKDIFRLLDQELETAYGKTIDWKAVTNPRDDFATRLKQDIRLAVEGDNPGGDILWQTILFQDVETKKQAYIHLSPAQKNRFDREFKTVFMIHAAPIPLVNAKKLLALMEAGVLTVRKTQKPFSANTAGAPGTYDFYYEGPDGKTVCETFHWIVDARGQSLSFQTNPSPLAKNMLASGVVQPDTRTTETPETPESLGLLIDPETCGVMTGSREQGFSVSQRLFAVGIMTQGQIINASMARECVVSTRKVAAHLLSECP